jgi:hypothetical protein
LSAVLARRPALKRYQDRYAKLRSSDLRHQYLVYEVPKEFWDAVKSYASGWDKAGTRRK